MVKIKFIRNDLKEFVIDGTDWAIPSTGIESLGIFENDISTVNNAIGDGGIKQSSRVPITDRTIEAKSRNPKNNEVLRDAAKRFFSPKRTYEVYVTYMGVTRWFEGEIKKFYIPPGNIHRSMSMAVTFLCVDPYWRSVENFGKNIAATIPMAAFPFLCTSEQGVTAGRYNFAKNVAFENDGDVETNCRVEMTAKGEVTNPKVMINGGYVRVIDIMVEGDVIVIDFTKNPPTVKKNGVNYIGHCDRTSTFDEMAIPIGSTAVSFDADNGSNMLDVTFYYNKLYSVI